MFPLQREIFPENAAALEVALSESLGSFFVTTVDPVRITDAAYPCLQEIAIVLHHARLRGALPQPSLAMAGNEEALRVQSITIAANALSVGPASFDLGMSARDVVFSCNCDQRGQLVLGLKSATDGTIEVVADQREFEAAIAAVVRSEASKQGVAIESVSLALTPHGPRDVGAEVLIRARKLFLSANIRITARLALDDRMTAKLSGLACTGEGAIASLACGVLAPHLQKLEGRAFSLLSLPLGEIRLRDVRIAVAEKIRLFAEFGA